MKKSAAALVAAATIALVRDLVYADNAPRLSVIKPEPCATLRVATALQPINDLSMALENADRTAPMGCTTSAGRPLLEGERLASNMSASSEADASQTQARQTACS